MSVSASHTIFFFVYWQDLSTDRHTCPREEKKSAIFFRFVSVYHCLFDVSKINLIFTRQEEPHCREIEKKKNEIIHSNIFDSRIALEIVLVYMKLSLTPMSAYSSASPIDHLGVDESSS